MNIIVDSLGMLIARKWIAGSSLDKALAEAQRINAKKEKVIMNYLGEDLRSRREVTENMHQIMLLIRGMGEKRIKGSIAVKPTQIGLSVNAGYFERNLHSIAAEAGKRGITVWIDMEQYRYVDGSIRAYLKSYKKHKNIGICIQAKLRRSLKDIERISKANGRIRLVKGAYKYPSRIAFEESIETYGNYLKCMDYLFRHANGFMIATHDDKIIDIAIEKEKQMKKKASFGMLKGIRAPLAAKLAESGEDINIYMPYGEQWLKYSMRRLTEWEHAKIILQSVIKN